MTGLFSKLADYATTSTKQKGPYVLLALVMPVERPHGWDLLASAEWMSGSTRQEIERISSELDGYLSTDEKLALSRIVVLEPSNPVVVQLSHLPAASSSEANPTHRGLSINNHTEADVVVLASTPRPSESAAVAR